MENKGSGARSQAGRPPVRGHIPPTHKRGLSRPQNSFSHPRDNSASGNGCTFNLLISESLGPRSSSLTGQGGARNHSSGYQRPIGKQAPTPVRRPHVLISPSPRTQLISEPTPLNKVLSYETKRSNMMGNVALRSVSK